MSIIVSTMVRMTTSVAPKLRDRSLRKVESNNIFGLSNPGQIMDFKHQIASAGTLAGVAADALVVVTHGDSIDPSLDAAVASPIKEAVALGDLQFKQGRTLYVQKPAGLKTPRLV